jgi:3-hydroxyacyl-CoA dehydrogenase
MTAPRTAIACLGAGRMGRGIAVAFAYAGHAVTMIDVKPRSTDAFASSRPRHWTKSGKRWQPFAFRTARG